MSLDVTLLLDGHDMDDSATYCIRCGWSDAFPNSDCPRPREVYTDNITHNLNKMALAAGLYEALWHPEELAVYQERLLLGDDPAPQIYAHDLIEPIRAGLAKLKADPAYYETFNASNGWGLYKHFVPFVEKYLRACEQFPTARVEVSR